MRIRQDRRLVRRDEHWLTLPNFWDVPVDICADAFADWIESAGGAGAASHDGMTRRTTCSGGTETASSTERVRRLRAATRR